MNVAQRLVDRLVENEIDVLFTVPGEQHDAIFEALAESSIRVVHTRHEQAAAFMAYGYARSSEKVAALLVISGPGVLYATPGLATAFAGSVRVLCIASQISTAFHGRGLGVPHELPDQFDIVASMSGWAGRISSADLVDMVLDEAFHRLAQHRPRPVTIEIPVDVMNEQVSAQQEWTPPSAPPLDFAAVEAARVELRGARTPIIYVGSGARGCADQIRRLAEVLQAPVTTEIGGRGILAPDHDLFVTFPVAHRIWSQVDVVLAIGTRLRRPQAEWGIGGLRIVRVDLDEAEMNRSGAPAVAVVGDASKVVTDLLRDMEQVHDRIAWLTTVADARRTVKSELALLEPQMSFLQAMRAALPSNGFFVDELTQVGYAAWATFDVLKPATYISSTYLGALGFGFATALGVKIAHPERPVLSISGDGGFLYTAADLATAMQHKIAIVAVVFDDGSYSNVARSQDNRMDRTINTELRNPDFVAFAAAFGAVGVRVDNAEELGTEIEKAFTRTGMPTVIVVPVGPMPSPWSFIRLPQVRQCF